MSEIMQARAVMTKKINVMARKIEGITTFVLTGNDEYSPNEIYYVVAAAGDNAPPKVVTDMNFLIREFLKPSDIKKNESDGRTLVDYVFEGGLNAQVLTAHGVDEKVQKHIANAYRLIFHGQTSVFDAVIQVKEQVPDSLEISNIVNFISNTKLGIIGKM